MNTSWNTIDGYHWWIPWWIATSQPLRHLATQLPRRIPQWAARDTKVPFANRRFRTVSAEAIQLTPLAVEWCWNPGRDHQKHDIDLPSRWCEGHHVASGRLWRLVVGNPHPKDHARDNKRSNSERKMLWHWVKPSFQVTVADNLPDSTGILQMPTFHQLPQSAHLLDPLDPSNHTRPVLPPAAVQLPRHRRLWCTPVGSSLPGEFGSPIAPPTRNDHPGRRRRHQSEPQRLNTTEIHRFIKQFIRKIKICQDYGTMPTVPGKCEAAWTRNIRWSICFTSLLILGL